LDWISIEMETEPIKQEKRRKHVILGGYFTLGTCVNDLRPAVGRL
jgi:hypothetical protein